MNINVIEKENELLKILESIENVLEYLRLRYLNYDVNIEKLDFVHQINKK